MTMNKKSFMEEYSAWHESGVLSSAELEELDSVSGDEKEIESRFFSNLEFGTAGLRGVMGVGLYRMNAYVVRHTTQALCELIKAEPGDKGKCVAICYDPRINSESFAREAACVVAANGLKVRIFDSLRPTPELSFVIRHYRCIAGINITASHNPKEYNGYKVYWADGAQLPPQKAADVAEKMSELDIFTEVRTTDYDEAVKSGHIRIMSTETDELFLRYVLSQASDFSAAARAASKFKLVYTPFHGAGYKLVPEALRRLGIEHIICVSEQMKPDGEFPTVSSPNPENPEGFSLAIALAEKNGANLIIGTDPDADRIGVMARGSDGKYVHISGNQIGVLLLDYIIGARTRAGTLPKNPAALKTIVTTELARRVAEKNGVSCFDTFTGFKFMAEKKNELEATGKGTVIFSYEESYGYMAGNFVRDKDAVTASVLITEMAAWYYTQGMTLLDALERIYKKYGYYIEETKSFMMPGLDGIARMRKLMNGLRVLTPKEIAGSAVIEKRDYLSGFETNMASGDMIKMELSGSNVLRFGMEDSTVVIVRPSGTEPKVKIYIMVSGDNRAECAERIKKYTEWAEIQAGS